MPKTKKKKNVSGLCGEALAAGLDPEPFGIPTTIVALSG